jgi:hypothetical protein
LSPLGPFQNPGAGSAPGSGGWRAERFQAIQHEVGTSETGRFPADDRPRKRIDDEGDTDETLPGGGMGEVGDPRGVRAFGRELTVRAIPQTRYAAIADGGLGRLAPHRAS